MSPRPVIFISAVSKELKSARQIVANTLTFLGYDPDWQEVSNTEQGDVPAILRRRIDGSKGVVQLVGKCYGAESPQPDPQFGRVSSTQYEALYARSRGKKVWYLIVDESFPTDPHEPEDEERQALQRAYRESVIVDAHLHHPLGSREALETSVLRLRDDLTRLRRGFKQWAAFVAVLLILIASAAAWLIYSGKNTAEAQSRAAQKQEETNRQLDEVKKQMAALNQGVTQFVEVQKKVEQSQPGQQPEEIEARTYEELAARLGVDAALLKEKLPQFARQLKSAADKSLIERARAAYVAKDYPEAERLAQAAADEAQRATPPKTADAIEAVELATSASEKRIEYARALQRLREAEKLTDRARDPLEWARVQWAIAHVLDKQGQYRESERILREVFKENERALGPEHPRTLAIRTVIANVIIAQGRRAEAEVEYRAILKLQEKVLGAAHAETLRSRNNLANALAKQGKHPAAEAEYRAVLQLKDKVFGPEHLSTLTSRHNLGEIMRVQGKYAEAEAEHRAVLRLKEKVLAPEHPSLLNTRNGLGEAIRQQGRFAEAEAEHRAVLQLREKTLGSEHPDTLSTRNNLANALAQQGKHAEVEAEHRARLKIEERILGPEHPSTLDTRNNLAAALFAQHKDAEAEAEFRAILRLHEKVIGLEHPATLRVCYNLAWCLRAQRKTAEARELARRAAEGVQKVLRAEHPAVKTYEALWKELQADNR